MAIAETLGGVAYEGLTHDTVIRYAEERGWRPIAHPTERPVRVLTRGDDARTGLFVPLDPGLSDYQALLRLAVRTLAAEEDLPIQAVADEVTNRNRVGQPGSSLDTNRHLAAVAKGLSLILCLALANVIIRALARYLEMESPIVVFMVNAATLVGVVALFIETGDHLALVVAGLRQRWRARRANRADGQTGGESAAR